MNKFFCLAAISCSVGAAELLRPELTVQGALSIRVDPGRGRSLTVFRSSDLKAWVPVTNLVGQTLPPRILLAPKGPIAFYRLREFPPVSPLARAVFINPQADPSSSLVLSEFSGQSGWLPTFIQGSHAALNIFLVDGGFHPQSGSHRLRLTMSLGLPGQPAIAQTSDFTPISNGWQGVLDLRTQAAADAVSSSRRVEVVWQLTGEDVETGLIQTYALVRAELSKGLQ